MKQSVQNMMAGLRRNSARKFLNILSVFVMVVVVDAQETGQGGRVPITLDNLDDIGIVKILSVDSIVNGIAWSPDGRTLAMASDRGVWFYASGNFDIASQFLEISGSGVYQVTFSPNGDYIALDTGEGARIVSAETLTDLMASSDYRAIAFASDSATVAIAGWDTVTLVNFETGEELAAFDYPEMESCEYACGFVDALFSPDDTLLIAQSYSMRSPMWDITTEEIIAYPEVSGNSGTVSFSPDGTLLVSAGGRSIAFLDGHTGERLLRLWSPSSESGSVDFSPDGTILVSGGVDEYSAGQVVLWDVNAILQLESDTIDLSALDDNYLTAAVLTGHGSAVNCVAFNPAGTLIASGAGDGSIILWGIVDD